MLRRSYNLNQWGVFLQDTWQVTNNLSLQYGVRVDIPLMSDKPIYNPAFAPHRASIQWCCYRWLRSHQPDHHQWQSRGAAAHVVQLRL